MEKTFQLTEVEEYNFLGNIIDNKGKFKKDLHMNYPRKHLKRYFH